MSVRIVTFPYKVSGIKLVEGSILEVDLSYNNQNINANSLEEYERLCEQEAETIGLNNEITVYHTCVNYQPAVGQIVGVQFVYEDVFFFGEDGQPKNKPQLIEYQQLLLL